MVPLDPGAQRVLPQWMVRLPMQPQSQLRWAGCTGRRMCSEEPTPGRAAPAYKQCIKTNTRHIRLAHDGRTRKERVMHSLPNALDELMTIKCWQAAPLSCYVHPGHVVHGAKHSYLVIYTTICFHALKQLLGIVQDLNVQRYVLLNKVCRTTGQLKLLFKSKLSELGKRGNRNHSAHSISYHIVYHSIS